MSENKLYKKYFTNILLGILVVNLIITSLLYLFLIEKGKTNIYKDYIKSAQINFIKTQSYLNLRIEHFKGIINTLEESNDFKEYVNRNNKTPLVDTFKLLLSTNKSLFQIRFINNEGIEEVRVDKDNQLNIYESNNLQDKSNRLYFQKTISEKKGTFFISDLNLNIEFDKIQVPYQPTIRVSKPVYVENKVIGILIINYKVDEIIDFIQNQEAFDVYIMDSDKNFFLHPDKSKNFSTLLKTNFNVSKEIENIDLLMEKNNQIDINSKYYLTKIDITNNPFYIIYSLKDNIYQKMFNDVKNDVFFIFLLVFIITLPLVFYFLNRQSIQSVILESIIDNIPFPIFLKDINEKLLMLNESMLKLTGFSEKSDLIGKRLNEVMNEEEASKLQLKFDKSNSINSLKSEIEILNKDGKKYFYDVKIIKLSLLGYFKKYYILGIAVDITELKSLNLQLKDLVNLEIKNRIELERALLQQSKMAEMGNMIGNIIHQWKQPLSIISVLATGNKLKIENNIVESKDLISTLEHIEEQVLFINETAQDFREFFSPNKEKEYFLLKNLTTKISRILSSRFSQVVINFHNEISEELSVFGYENDFGQVLLSILNNAIDECEKCQKDSYEISIKSIVTDNSVIIRIEDNAELIPEELLPDKIFEQYFTTKKEGTGLGLSICKKIIEENFGGEIRAFNEENFAIFEIVLPIEK